MAKRRKINGVLANLFWYKKAIIPPKDRMGQINIMIEYYENRVALNKIISWLFLGCSAYLAYWGFSNILYKKIEKHFLEPELASIIAVTDGINFNSILYQWLPYISAIFIIGGLVLVLLKYYRRHIDLVIYYNSIISSLNFFKVLFKDELDSDLGFGDSISDYKEKIILGFAETQNPSYVFEHVLATKKNKCCREEGGNIEQILATLGKTVDDLKEIVAKKKT